jgi:hypothetical protein
MTAPNNFKAVTILTYVMLIVKLKTAACRESFLTVLNAAKEQEEFS